MNRQNDFQGSGGRAQAWPQGGNAGGYATPQASGTGYNSPSGMYGNAEQFFQGAQGQVWQQQTPVNPEGSYIPQTAWMNPQQATGQNRFPQNRPQTQQQPYAPRDAGLFQQNAYPAGQSTPYTQQGTGYQVPRQETYPVQNNSFSYQQTGYQQPGYQQVDYQQAAYQQTGYQQPGGNFQAQQTGGWNPGAFSQMGRDQAAAGRGYNPSQGIPMNGGGYVPPKRPVRRQPFRFNNTMLMILCVILVALFAAGMAVPYLGMLKWVFVGLTVISLVYFWLKNPIAENIRLCFSVVFGALLVVAVVSGVTLADKTTRGPTTEQQGGTQVRSEAVYGPTLEETVNSPVAAVSPSTPTPPPEDGATDADTLSVLQEFFYYWSANKYDEMLNLCLPSWRSSVDNPNTALFAIRGNRTPLDYVMEKISGTVDDTSRTVTLTSTMDRNNGKDPVKYRMSVIMGRENDAWYVDPRSLKTYEAAEPTVDPATITEKPTIEPMAAASTVLYYNPGGGTKYHLDQNCISTHSKYLPLKGQFTFGQVNDEPYNQLEPCNICAAPLR